MSDSPCIGKADCPCTYPCEKHGKCCMCVSYHQRSGQLPACYFDKETEKTYDRSIDNYLKSIKRK